MSYVGNPQNSHVSGATESKLNLLVRYLDHAVDDDQLRCFFAQFGEITSSMVMRDILTGESRGFGFVRFSRHADAARAMAGADGKKIGGKALNVLWAKQQHDVTPAGQDRLKVNKLFLRNVPMDVTEQDLIALVSHCGEVAEVSLHNDKISAACHVPSRRIAFIVFNTEGAAEAALHAVHNTCPFRSCLDIPLMAKLSEDYKAKVSHANGDACITAAQRPSDDTALCRYPLKVLSVSSVLKFAGHHACSVSTPNSMATLSSGTSSFVPSLGSASQEEGAELATRPLSAAEVERSLHSSHLFLRTPACHRSSGARVYRHSPYGSMQMIPATLASNNTSVYSGSMMGQRMPRRA
ncbi:hypothetical protein ABL78_7235 [Leptomonas seymouri]|uniref:RRM domain-containing protein n=1 Tax=Leptomonas seymouri TaxID=5684 RepID=A0A0N1HUA1_LEPSE|nr:hypothetical protein ABL78_7235 [Leptomonas seymouri]|eukprot:KPI83732.1 hypothetical protein ABL78_7235 [Leptomonas seymouri]